MEGIFYVNMYLKPLEHQIIVVSSIWGRSLEATAA